MYKKNLVILGGTILVGLLLFISMVLNTSEAIASKNIKLDEKVKYTLIKEKAVQNGSKISMLHKFENEAEIKDFVALANDKLTELSEEKNFDKPFIATITLKKPLSLQEFENLVFKYEIDICDYKIRAFEEDGTRVTICSKPKNDSLFNKDIIFDADEQYTVAGVIAFTCNVDENNLDKIVEMKNDNNNVYIIDVDSYFVGNDVKEQTGKNIGKVKANDIYWYLEDYNLTDQ